MIISSDSTVINEQALKTQIKITLVSDDLLTKLTGYDNQHIMRQQCHRGWIMHYYSFNIADYKKDTDYLKPIEHYIYRSLIDRYYLDEIPIPKETQPLLRRLKLESEVEIEGLNFVLNEFFTLEDDGYHHSRIDNEIAKYQANAEKNRENGKKGGRPPKNKPKITQSVVDGLPVNSQINLNQELSTTNQELSTTNQELSTTNQEPSTTNQEPSTTNQEPSTSLPFDDFWNAYDYKQGSLVKLKAKWQSLTVEQRKLIMSHVLDYVKSTPNKKFRKHPLTYLNNESWLDEITELGGNDAEQDSSARPHSNRSDSFESQSQAKSLSRDEQIAANKINMAKAGLKV
ncbi:MAG: YdaU family protein [Psychrobacter sp.]